MVNSIQQWKVIRKEVLEVLFSASSMHKQEKSSKLKFVKLKESKIKKNLWNNLSLLIALNLRMI